MRIDRLFGNTPDSHKISPQKSNEDGNTSIFLRFNDSDGIIDENDIQYLNDISKEIAVPYLCFLKSYCDGKHEWTGFMLDTVNLLLEAINTAYKDYNENYNCNVTGNNIVLSDDEGNEILEMYHENDKMMYLFDYKNGQHAETIEKEDGTITITNVDRRKDTDSEESLFFGSRHHTVINTYRTDGSLYEKNDDNNISEIYNRSGQLISRSYKQNTPAGKIITKERYRDNKIRCKEEYEVKQFGFNKKEELLSRIMYDKDGHEITVAEYKDNELISYTDNRIKENNIFFDETKLNGSIEEPIKQGLSGICYMVGIVNSMYFSKNPANIEDLNNVVSYDNEAQVATVNFKGLGLTYTIPMADIEAHMTRLGTNDPDFPAMALAYEKYLLYLDASTPKSERPSDDARDIFNEMYNTPVPKKKTIDSGQPHEFYFAITGKKMKADYLDDKTFSEAKKSLAKGGIVNAGTPEYNAHSSEKFMSSHNYSVLEIDEKNNKVTLYEPNLEEYYYPTIEEFKREFAQIYYN